MKLIILTNSKRSASIFTKERLSSFIHFYEAYSYFIIQFKYMNEIEFEGYGDCCGIFYGVWRMF